MEIVQHQNGSTQQMNGSRDKHIQLNMGRITFAHLDKSIPDRIIHLSTVGLLIGMAQLLPGGGDQAGSLPLRLVAVADASLVGIIGIGTGQIGHKADHIEATRLLQHLQQGLCIRIARAIKD